MTENNSNNQHISDVLKDMLDNPTRRGFLKGSSAFLTAAAGVSLAGCGSDDLVSTSGSTPLTALNFEAVPPGGTASTQATFVGAELGETRLRRFLTGPAGCEITGIAESADGRAIFVNVQHPGEDTTAAFWTGTAPQSQWPGNEGYGVTGRPRSATIVITRVDGGLIGV